MLKGGHQHQVCFPGEGSSQYPPPEVESPIPVLFSGGGQRGSSQLTMFPMLKWGRQYRPHLPKETMLSPSSKLLLNFLLNFYYEL